VALSLNRHVIVSDLLVCCIDVVVVVVVGWRLLVNKRGSLSEVDQNGIITLGRAMELEYPEECNVMVTTRANKR
jgi:hypothetical protein